MEEQENNLFKGYQKLTKGTLLKVNGIALEIVGVWWLGDEYHGFDMAAATATAELNSRRKIKFILYNKLKTLKVEKI
tara:strand:- start:35757 stop:35987 length:231 start_codon:yes stop_codon:yes gene_type:complete